MRMIRRLAIAATFGALLTLAGCGDGSAPDDAAPPVASPQQTEAIASVIDAELTETEQQCMLVGLLDTGIDAGAIVNETVTSSQDAELLAVAASCIEDFSTVPGFVESFIDSAAAEGTVLSEAQAICLFRNLDEGQAEQLLDECLQEPAESGDATLGYGDDPTLDLYWEGCADGNSQLCDELYRLAPFESEYLEFARTCGGLLPESVGYRCFDELG